MIVPTVMVQIRLEGYCGEIILESCYTALAMDAKSHETLELSLVLELLASYTAFSASRELALTLAPLSDHDEVARRQAETSEACRLLSVRSELTIGGARDVRERAASAARGVILEPVDLLDIKSTLIAARKQRRYFEKTADTFPILKQLSLDLATLPGLVDSISQTLDDRGEVLDSASKKLGSIRSELRIAHDRLMSKLERMIGDSRIAPMLQEPIITQREGRFVIPLQADFKGRLKAVVHDQSASGATLFVEPLQVVDLNNQVRELQLAERDEIRRVLAELSDRIGEQSEAIIRTVMTLARLDLAFAKARYSESIDASEPLLQPFTSDAGPPHPGSTVRLLAARHPLLKAEEVVPIDLILDAETYALVITGPNTGGKTVSLKTAGLLALMAQCGLHIPAKSGSELSVFDAVYADIGDEQSIEQSLSTFSSHVSNIKSILDRATSKSLVLLDELGAGTDPQEGAALARAILGVLLERSITTLVATHYPEMKTFAHTVPGVRNASVEFDVQSLRPTYHLVIGLPGRSNALAIAARLGLDETIVARAREMLSPDDLHAERMLDEIHDQRERARQERIEAEAVREKANALEEKLSKRLNQIEEERERVLRDVQQEGEAELESLRNTLRQVRRELSRARLPIDAVKKVEAEIETIEAAFAEAIEPVDDEALPSVHSFKEGDAVFLQTISAEGVITTLDQDIAEVQVGRLRVRAGLSEMVPVKESTSEKRTTSRKRHPVEGGRGSSKPTVKAPPLELHVRGWIVDDALEELDRRLDAAFLAGMPFIRVVHGKGTGRLRRAIRKALEGNPYVASFEPGQASEGGDGVTIVRLNVI